MSSPPIISDVDVMDALGFQFSRPPNVVVIVGVPTVNDDVVAIKKRHKAAEAIVHHSRRYHKPNGAGLTELADEVLQRRTTGSALFGEGVHCVRKHVVHHALMAGTDQAADHVGAHSSESDHSELHGYPSD
jgi:hypothetical protein